MSVECIRGVTRGLALSAILLWTVGCSRTALTHQGPATAVGDTGFDSTASNDSLEEPIRPLSIPVGLDSRKVQLGRQLFNDRRLSRDNTISCASCHEVASGGDDGLKTAVGIDGQRGPLNTPTVLNASLFVAQFWDGRAASLAEQVPGPIHNPREMDCNWTEVLAKLGTDLDLSRRFKNLYPEGLTPESIVDAIVTYERALVTVDAPFDRYLRGDENAISQDVKQGYALFKDIGCITCHQGQVVGGNLFQKFGVMENYFATIVDMKDSDKGRFNVTRRSVDLYRFKVPSLRNVALTAPYFHNGEAETLDEAIAIMAEYQLGSALNDDEVGQIKSFLESLTGEVSRELR